MRALAITITLMVLIFPAISTGAAGLKDPPSTCGPKDVTQAKVSTWPDGPGYTGKMCTFDWVDISATGTELHLTDDSYDGPFALGFDFPLYKKVWTEAWVSSNGFINFRSGSAQNTNPCPASPEFGAAYSVAPLWDDLDPGVTQDPIYYQAFESCPTGSGRCFIAQWQDICRYPGGPDCIPAGTFQAIVYENGSIILQILDAGEQAGESSTTGIVGEDPLAGHGLTYACNEADSLSDQLCLQIEPVFGLYTYVVGGIAHIEGSQGTSWRSSFSVTNTSGEHTDLEFTFFDGASESIVNTWAENGVILEWIDVLTSPFGLGRDAAGSIKVLSDSKLFVTARTYNQTTDGTFGQYLPGLADVSALPPGSVGVLPSLKSNADFRTNIGFVNLGEVACELRYQLFNVTGVPLGGIQQVAVGPYRWKQDNRVFRAHGSQDIAYAMVELGNGDCRAWAYASVVDENTGDPTTIPVAWQE